MARFWSVLWFEYWEGIKRPGYLMFTFIFPIFICFIPFIVGGIILGAIWAALPEIDPRPIGLVDRVELLAEDISLPDTPVSLEVYPSLEEAQKALAGGTIQAYYHIQPDYWSTGHVEAVYENPPPILVETLITLLIERQVEAQVPPDVLALYRGNPEVSQYSLDSNDVFSTETIVDWGIIFGIIFFTFQLNLFSAVRIFDSIGSEADNRTIEIILSSISTTAFITGKLCGLILVGLTQVFIWLGGILVLVIGLGSLREVNVLTVILEWEHLGLVVTILFGAYILNQIIAAALGLLKIAGGMGTQLFNALGWVLTAGLFYAVYFIPRNPHTPTAIIASIFPLTAPVVLLVRDVVSTVPGWQIVAAHSALWGTNLLGLVWLRYLLRANLVKYAPTWNFWAWAKKAIRKKSIKRISGIG